MNGQMPRLLAGDPPRAGLLVEALRAGPHQAGGRARARARGGRRGGGRDGEERRRGRRGRLGGRLQSAVRLAAYRDATGHYVGAKCKRQDVGQMRMRHRG